MPTRSVVRTPSRNLKPINPLHRTVSALMAVLLAAGQHAALLAGLLL